MGKTEANPAADIVEHADKKPEAIEHATAKLETEAAVKVDTVRVRAIKTFGVGPDHRTPNDKPFEVSKQRAAELRMNGLIEYATAEDEDAAHMAAAKRAGDAVRKRIDEAPKLPDSAKSTPLRQHPATLKIAE